MCFAKPRHRWKKQISSGGGSLLLMSTLPHCQGFGPRLTLQAPSMVWAEPQTPGHNVHKGLGHNWELLDLHVQLSHRPRKETEHRGS